MKCQNLFSEKNKESIISLSSAELVQRVVKIKYWYIFNFMIFMAWSPNKEEG